MVLVLGPVSPVLAREGVTLGAARQADAPPADTATPPARAPRDRRAQLDALFSALRLAPDAQSAKAVSEQLDVMFNQTGSASADLLMARASVAAEAQEYDLALELLEAVLVAAPDDLGAFALRATVHYAQDDYDAALADVAQVLAREPRHPMGLFGLALILRELGDDKAALDAARRALAVYPHLEGASEMVDELTLTVEGQAI